MASPEFQGFVFVLTLYDVCDEINLQDLPRLIGGRRPVPAFKHTTPEYVRFERPPVIESLEPVALETGERFDVTIQYYDYGVVSVVLRHSYSGTWTGLQDLAAHWISSNLFEELTARLVRQRVASVTSALRNVYKNQLNEDYYIFHLPSSAEMSAADLLREHGGEISQIISGESALLAQSEREEMLQGRMSYYPNDLTIVAWNAAFIYDTDSAAESTIRLLEYANSQLLQFRHYDELLTQELTGFSGFQNRRGAGIAGWRMHRAATRLRAVFVDVTQLTERTINALKFVGDMFSARLYRLSAARIGVVEYQRLVEEKLQTADDLYDFMTEEFHQARTFMLEVAVVIILLIELGFLFRGK